MEAEDLQASDVVTAWSIKLASSDPENHLAQTVWRFMKAILHLLVCS